MDIYIYLETHGSGSRIIIMAVNFFFTLYVDGRSSSLALHLRGGSVQRPDEFPLIELVVTGDERARSYHLH